MIVLKAGIISYQLCDVGQDDCYGSARALFLVVLQLWCLRMWAYLEVVS